MEEDPHAVRWGKYERVREHEIVYTQWHWTTDGNRTVCNRPIFITDCVPFPDTDEQPERVGCAACQRWLRRNGRNV